MLEGKFIICYTANNWEVPWGVTQKVMEKLARHNRILFIEYQMSFLHRYIQNFSYTNQSNKKRGMIKKLSENLYVYTPSYGLPFNNYFRGINILNQRRMCENIKSEIDKNKPRDIIFWIFVPYAVDFLRGFARYFTIYHCAGDFPAEKNNFFRKKTVAKMEHDLLGQSDLVVAQTESLCRKFNALGKKTFYLPSVSSPERHGEIKIKNWIGTRELERIKRPRIGIVGYFNDAFYDTGILEYLIDARKEWSFVFVGPLQKKARNFINLRKKKNAFFLGEKNPDEISYYIDKMDIGIIPYKLNSYMREVSPNKFYEYVACGKPVVSVNLPDLVKYKGVVEIAEDKNDFLKYMQSFLSQGNTDYMRQRALELAKENSLDGYLDSLSTVIKGTMNA